MPYFHDSGGELWEWFIKKKGGDANWKPLSRQTAHYLKCDITK